MQNQETGGLQVNRLQRIQEMLLRQGVRATHTLRYLASGMIERAKTGPKVQAKLGDALQEFISYNIGNKPPFDKNPLNEEQIAKLTELAQCEEEDASIYLKLLKKVSHKDCTRLSFCQSDWRALEKVNFLLIQNHFNQLVELYNSNLLDPIQAEMEELFGVDYKEAVVAEVMAKSLAYIPRLAGKELSLPIKGEDGEYKLVRYHIDAIKIGDSLPCYILEADEDLPVWFVARGTNMQGNGEFKESLESFLADTLDRKGLAKDAIVKAMFHPTAALVDRFGNWEKKGQLIIFAGHSLGGFIVTDIASRFHEQVRCSYSFNGTGVDQKTADKLNSLFKKEQGFEQKFVNFSCHGDFVSSGGGILVGNQIEISLDCEEETDPIHMHLKFLLNKPFHAQAVCIETENQKSIRRVSEILRSSLGKVLEKSITWYDHSMLPDWWMNRKHYRQLVKEHESRACKISSTDNCEGDS